MKHYGKKQLKKTNIIPYINFSALFIKGFRSLPSHWGTVYRGCRLDPSKFKEKEYIVFQGFTSASKKKVRC